MVYTEKSLYIVLFLYGYTNNGYIQTVSGFSNIFFDSCMISTALILEKKGIMFFTVLLILQYYKNLQLFFHSQYILLSVAFDQHVCDGFFGLSQISCRLQYELLKCVQNEKCSIVVPLVTD